MGAGSCSGELLWVHFCIISRLSVLFPWHQQDAHHVHTCGGLQQGQPARGTHPRVTPSHPTELFPANLLPEALLQDNPSSYKSKNPAPKGAEWVNYLASRTELFCPSWGCLQEQTQPAHTFLLPGGQEQKFTQIHPSK